MVDKYLIMPSKHSKSVKSSHLYFAIFIIPLILYILIIKSTMKNATSLKKILLDYNIGS